MLFPTHNAIKSTAKLTLSNHWPKAVAIVFIVMGAALLPSLMFQLLDIITASNLSKNEAVFSAIDSIYGLFILFPLLFGVLRWIWGVTAQTDMPLSSVFASFASPKEYKTALKVCWAFSWRLEIASIPYYLSLALGYLDLSFLPKELDISIIIPGIQGFCSILSFVLSAFVIGILLPLPFLVINHPFERIRENVKESILIYKAVGSNYVSFIGSLFGWFLLSLLILPLFYTIPFLLACWAVLARFSINYCIYNKK